MIESKILSQGGERRFWFGSRREWISCRTSSQHAWMGCQQWSGQVQLFSASVSSSARRWTSIIAKIIMMSTTLTGVHGVVTATLKQQSSGQWKTNHSSGSLLLLPIVILFLISCWINSVPLHPRPVPYFDPHPQHLLSTWQICLIAHFEMINFLSGWRRRTLWRMVNFLRSFSSERTFFGTQQSINISYKQIYMCLETCIWIVICK